VCSTGIRAHMRWSQASTRPVPVKLEVKGLHHGKGLKTCQDLLLPKARRRRIWCLDSL